MNTLAFRLGTAVAAGLLIACAREPAAATAQDSAPWRIYLGAADASAAVHLGRGTVAVGDDEDNVLRLYDAEHGGTPRAVFDVSGFLGLAPGDEADIEAAARIGDRIYWISSHGRSRKGRIHAERRRFFATTVAEEHGEFVLRPLGRPCTGLLQAMGPALDAVLGTPRATLDPGQLDIEALAADPDGRTLWIGLRAPVVRRDGRDRAIVLPLRNASAVVESGEAPQFGEPLLWDLDGRTPRDMLGLSGGRGVLVLAVGRGTRHEWRLYRWSAEAGGAPRAVPVEGPADLGSPPEALAELPEGRLLVLIDDGDRLVPVSAPADCARGEYRSGGNCPNKHLRNAERKSFRGFEVVP